MSDCPDSIRLPREFYARSTLTVACALLGQRLVRVLGGQRLSGLIIETEAYGGPDDESSHAFRRTRRSAIMYGPSGHAYVYFIYGMYFCLNAVTEADGTPGAVLMRAIWPQEGVAIMRARRRRASAPPGGDTESQPKGDIPDRHLADGPGKLCQALGITREQNGLDLTTGRELFIEAQPAVPPAEIIATPRVGVKGNHDARARPWRFLWQPATCP